MMSDDRVNIIMNRMKRAMKLEDALFDEVEHDPAANRQGLYIIAIVSAAQAIGRGLERVVTARPLSDIVISGAFGFVETVVGLALWSYILYFISTKIFKATATSAEIWRTTSFARSPGVFFVIPFIGFLVNIWILAAYVKAAKHALDLPTGKTLLAALVSLIPFLFLQGALIAFISPLFF